MPNHPLPFPSTNGGMAEDGNIDGGDGEEKGKHCGKFVGRIICHVNLYCRLRGTTNELAVENGLSDIVAVHAKNSSLYLCQPAQLMTDSADRIV